MVTRLAYRSFRAATAGQDLLGRRLTPAGQLALAALVASVVLGPNTRLTVAYQAFAFLFALLVVASALAVVPPPRLGVRRRLPRFATAGEPLTYRVVLRNPTPRAQSGLSLLEDLDAPHPSFEDFLSTPEPGEERRNWFDRSVGYPRWAWLVAARRRATIPEQPLATLPPHGEVEVVVRAVVRSRGSLRLRGATVARTDPFGLVRATSAVDAPGSVLVLPRRYPLPPLALPGTRRYQPGGVALAASVGDSEEFQSLRDYRPGDPLRRVHWRSLARAGRPIVKEFQSEFFVRHALVLDTFLPTASPAFEDAVSVAASFASTLPTQESLLELMFVGPDAYHFTAGHGVSQVDRMLEILACVQPCRDRPFAALHRLVVDRHAALSGCICVLLAWDEARRRLVADLRALGVPTLGLVVAEGPPAAGEPLAEAGVHRLQVGRVAEGLARL